jgi:uncharacterized protein with PIN domain
VKRVWLRFYAELNDFLPPERRMRAFEYAFYVAPSIRDVIESAGVPHTEVDLILVNGRSVDFSYVVEDGDRISVYPVFESIDIGPLVRVRPKPLRQARFVLDVHLGRLAAYLRMAGFDALYQNDYSDEQLAAISSNEQRILLTRDVGLLKRAVIMRGYWVRETSPRLQLAEVLRRFDLFGQVTPFVRCLACNAPLEPVAKEDVAARVPATVRAKHNSFQRCPSCGRIYWPGTHYQRMQRMLAGLER